MDPTMTADSDVATLEFDGSSKGNPGRGGYGFLLKSGEEEITDSGFIGDDVTNNQAEYTALLRGLKKADNAGVSRVRVRGDSELVIKQMTGEYGVNSDNIVDLYEEACEVVDQFENVDFEHIDRGSNLIADDLAQEAAE
ncbi:ribonuclease HI family protein [Halapricum hydrolyticum]|uniref:Ribonuclease HI family protein n=1 Tax=Halapricum hydrolyticum TaxID=2979991 RepID=A0AAE3LF77_9EURY|nr:ribonuclease HI family protein [Halapricum hydrolyticum]MCU4717885.1 ribonuclease HI family protein [Halapricum hydrolyticum]MCU4727050.1 ribonuclease HI family protein [Halapricum hydrolyticum]